VRCHKIGGTGGEVGPDLSQIAKDKSREYLLESIVLPSKTIAKNFESVIIHDADGRVLTGVLKGKTDEATTLITAEGKVIEIANADIDEQSFGKSAMPEDLHTKMSAFELRDVVEFLSTLK
jgi:quinoprotein glucose dehydrogenase